MDNSIRQGLPSLLGLVAPWLDTFLMQVRYLLNARCQKVVKATTVNTATPYSLWEGQMPADSAWLLEAAIVARATDGSAAFYERSVRYKRTAGGTPTVVRTTTPIADDEDVAGWDVTFAASASGVITVSVTGDATRTVHWLGWIVVQEAPRREP